MREIASKVIVRLCARAPVYHCCQRCSGPVVVVGTFWCQGTLARLRDSNDASRVLTLVFSEPKDIFTFKVKGLNSFSLHSMHGKYLHNSTVSTNDEFRRIWAKMYFRFKRGKFGLKLD